MSQSETIDEELQRRAEDLRRRLIEGRRKALRLSPAERASIREWIDPTPINDRPKR